MSNLSKRGVMIAAPASGSGKTVVTLGLLRALQMRGVGVAGAKAGPDYIDPGFHAAACGKPSVNLDPWAMSPSRLRYLALNQGSSHLIVEAAMGLFDGAADGSASPASLARQLRIPVVLVVDAAKQSHSIAALVRGFRDHDQTIDLAGVILNRVGSARHEVMLRDALAAIDVMVFGAIPRDKRLVLPDRHLGLVQAQENSDLEYFIDYAAKIIAEHCNLDLLLDAAFAVVKSNSAVGRLPPLGQRLAIAHDEAFSFLYPHMLNDWKEQGAQISFFSPLADEAPNMNVDAVYLPGGYPELHVEKLAQAERFKAGMKEAQENGIFVYGECGGYMILGECLIDASGKSHAMCGLLKLETSFEKRKLHLGYRQLKTNDFPLGNSLRGHEFHYTSALKEQGEPLFDVSDALGNSWSPVGLRSGKVMGSYMHVIDRVPM